MPGSELLQSVALVAIVLNSYFTKELMASEYKKFYINNPFPINTDLFFESPIHIPIKVTEI